MGTQLLIVSNPHDLQRTARRFVAGLLAIDALGQIYSSYYVFWCWWRPVVSVDVFILSCVVLALGLLELAAARALWRNSPHIRRAALLAGGLNVAFFIYCSWLFFIRADPAPSAEESWHHILQWLFSFSTGLRIPLVLAFALWATARGWPDWRQVCLLYATAKLLVWLTPGLFQDLYVSIGEGGVPHILWRSWIRFAYRRLPDWLPYFAAVPPIMTIVGLRKYRRLAIWGALLTALLQAGPEMHNYIRDFRMRSLPTDMMILHYKELIECLLVQPVRIAGPWLMIAWLAARRWVPVPDDGSPWPRRYCGKCFYNLHGVESGRCPECGAELDEAGVASAEADPARA